MTKNVATVQNTRKNLLNRISDKQRDKAVTKVVTFSNQDVPKFLRDLDRFEAESAKVNHSVR